MFRRCIAMLLATLAVSAAAGLSFAGGDQNQGTTGIGQTHLGEQAQGTAEQPRVGR
ncbi:MAG: hypothetical protein ACP5G2_06930 [Candidatus Bipolaricaulaceae bacterium]